MKFPSTTHTIQTTNHIDPEKKKRKKIELSPTLSSWNRTPPELDFKNFFPDVQQLVVQERKKKKKNLTQMSSSTHSNSKFGGGGGIFMAW